MTWRYISASAAISRLMNAEEVVIRFRRRERWFLADVDYSSSAGPRVLLTAVKETRQNGGDLRLAAVQALANFLG